MKKQDLLLSLTKRASFALLILALLTMFVSCPQKKKNNGTNQQSNQQKEKEGNKEDNKGKDPELKALNIKTYTIGGVDAKSGTITFNIAEKTITKEDITLTFQETDAPSNWTVDKTLPLKITSPNTETIKITMPATNKYKAFEVSTKIQVKKIETAPQDLHLKELKIFGADAKNGSVNIPYNKDKVEKTNITLAFEETENIPEFTVSSTPTTLESEGSTAKLTISTPATSKYNAWSKEVTVTRSKKDIASCVAQLTSSLTWVGEIVKSDISLPTQVQDFEGSQVSWGSSRPLSCTATGVIGREIIDMEVELTATVTWNGETKTQKYKLTVARLKEIIDSSDPSSSKKYDFNTEGTLVYHVGNKPECKYSYTKSDVDVENHTIKLKLTHVYEPKPQGGADFVTVQEYIKNNPKYKHPVGNADKIKTILGAEYKGLIAKSSITWDEFRDYAEKVFLHDGYTKAQLTEEKIFELLGEKPPFVYRWGEVMIDNLTDLKNANATVKNDKFKRTLTGIKEYLTKEEGLPDTIEVDVLKEKIVANMGTKITYLTEKLGREKTYDYTLEKKSDATKYPSGYAFEGKTAYQAGKSYLEQNGSLQFVKTDGKRIELSLENKNADASYKVKATARISSAHAEEKGVGILKNNQLNAKITASSSLSATIAYNTGNQKYILTVTSPAHFTGDYTYMFTPSLIGDRS